MLLVPEIAIVDAALHLLGGQIGELLVVEADGSATWRPLQVPGLSSVALGDMLVPIAELGSSLQHLRAFAAVLQGVSPPCGELHLLRAVAHAAHENCLGLREAAQLHEEPFCSHRWTGIANCSGTTGSIQHELGSHMMPNTFGSCWQGVGLVLEELLAGFEASVQKLQQEHLSSFAGPAEAARRKGDFADKHCALWESPLTLLRLSRWLQPWKRDVLHAAWVLDRALAEIGRRCSTTPMVLWSAASAEDLLVQLGSALKEEGLSAGPAEGGTSATWISSLWFGAMRPVLRAMDLWGSTGELEDPCSEFQCISGVRAGRREVLLLRPCSCFLARSWLLVSTCALSPAG